MPLLSICASQVNEYSFKVWDTTLQQTYDDAGINLDTVTAATLEFKDLKTNLTYTINILSDWEYVLGDGLLINILDFPNDKMGEYEYFPDWMYDLTVKYTYNSVEYSSSKTIGFRSIISNIVYQQLQQSDWVKELKCGCGCEKYSSAFRKFDFLDKLELASIHCLITQYEELLLALYKLTGTTHEYSS
jgi:hypothetical protein